MDAQKIQTYLSRSGTIFPPARKDDLFGDYLIEKIGSSNIPINFDLTICCAYPARNGIYVALLSIGTREGGRKMRDYMVFIHDPESAMVRKVDVVRAFSRRSALRKLQKLGFRKKKF